MDWDWYDEGSGEVPHPCQQGYVTCFIRSGLALLNSLQWHPLPCPCAVDDNSKSCSSPFLQKYLPASKHHFRRQVKKYNNSARVFVNVSCFTANLHWCRIKPSSAYSLPDINQKRISSQITNVKSPCEMQSVFRCHCSFLFKWDTLHSSSGCCTFCLPFTWLVMILLVCLFGFILIYVWLFTILLLAIPFYWFNYSWVNYWLYSRHLGFRLFKSCTSSCVRWLPLMQAVLVVCYMSASSRACVLGLPAWPASSGSSAAVPGLSRSRTLPQRQLATNCVLWAIDHCIYITGYHKHIHWPASLRILKRLNIFQEIMWKKIPCRYPFPHFCLLEWWC